MWEFLLIGTRFSGGPCIRDPCVLGSTVRPCMWEFLWIGCPFCFYGCPYSKGPLNYLGSISGPLIPRNSHTVNSLVWSHIPNMIEVLTTSAQISK